MSSGLEHRECSESLGAYVLGALPETESTQVELHLASCRECRAEFDWLRVAGDALPASVAQIAAPPALKGRVMSVVEGEAQLLQAAGHRADRPEPRRRRTPWWRLGSLTWRPVAALGAVCAVALVVVLLAASGGVETRTIQAQVLNPGWNGVRAALVVNGTRAHLAVSGVPAPKANHVDELWVKRGGAAPQPAGTFVVRSGSVAVGRPVRHGDLVLVTVEPGRGSKAPTTKPVLQVRI
jgi:anti-sigma-K factor RskA